MFGAVAFSDTPFSSDQGAFFVSAAFSGYVTVGAVGAGGLDLLLADASLPLDYAAELYVWSAGDRA